MPGQGIVWAAAEGFVKTDNRGLKTFQGRQAKAMQNPKLMIFRLELQSFLKTAESFVIATYGIEGITLTLQNLSAAQARGG
jgi:hypothetical protein